MVAVYQDARTQVTHAHAHTRGQSGAIYMQTAAHGICCDTVARWLRLQERIAEMLTWHEVHAQQRQDKQVERAVIVLHARHRGAAPALGGSVLRHPGAAAAAACGARSTVAVTTAPR